MTTIGGAGLLHRSENFEKFKTPCTFYKAQKTKDKYGCERITRSEDGVNIDLLLQPISDKAVLEDYGIRYERSLQASLFDDWDIRHFDFVKIYDRMYTVVGIKKYPSHRLLILEKQNGEE